MEFLRTLYEGWWGHLHFIRRYELRLLKPFLRELRGKKVLDLACGGGFYSEHFAKSASSVIGIDIDAHVIAIADKYHKPRNVSYVVTSAEKLPFENASFDAAVSVCALQHFSDDVGALKELHRVLKKGGPVLLSLNSWEYPHAPDALRKKHIEEEHIVSFYSKESLKKKMEQAGFEMVFARYLFCSPLSSWILERWYRSRRRMLYYFLFPLLYYTVILSDMLFCLKGGYELVAVARKA